MSGPRALTAEWHRVAPGDRPAAVAGWCDRRDRLAADGCHFWVFASAAEPDTYLECTEASDADSLQRARSRADLSRSADILSEVELT